MRIAGPQDGNASLYTAARKGFVDIVGLLLDHGADINRGDKVSQAVSQAMG